MVGKKEGREKKRERARGGGFREALKVIIYLLMGCMVARAVADFRPYMASGSDSPAALQSDDLFIDIQQDSAAAAPLEPAAGLRCGFSTPARRPTSPSALRHPALDCCRGDTADPT